MKEIELTQGKVAIVDDDDYEYLRQFNWFAASGGATSKYYAVRWEWGIKNGKKKYNLISMHRVINNTPKGMITDHKNLDTLDNRKENLRTCTISENSYNKAIHKNNKSGYKGVYINKPIYSYKGEKYKYEYITAQIKVNRKKISLGTFNTLEDAAKAYNKAALKYHGEYAQLNEVA